MTTIEKSAVRTDAAKPVECLVWRRKHGRGAARKDAVRPVWTLTPVTR